MEEAVTGAGKFSQSFAKKKQLSILRKAWESKAVPGSEDQGKRLY